jgi:hypothetical protein
MFQISDHAGDLLETPFYLRGICETRSNTPPNPCHACWKREFILQLRNGWRIVVRVGERQHQSKPPRIGRDGHQVQEENDLHVAVAPQVF